MNSQWLLKIIYGWVVGPQYFYSIFPRNTLCPQLCFQGLAQLISFLQLYFWPQAQLRDFTLTALFYFWLFSAHSFYF